jgi:predicted PurR-regulated permease PerM
MSDNRTARRSFSSPVLVAAFIIIIAGMIYASSIVTPILLSIFLSIICAQPMNWLEAKRVPHVIAMVIVLLGIVLIFALLGQLIGGSLAEFSQDAPQYAERLGKMETAGIQFLHDKGLEVSSDYLTKLLNPGKILIFTASLISGFGSFMSDLALIFFILIFILLELGSFTVKARAISKTPAETLEYLTRIGSSIRHYMAIKTLIGLLSGALIWVCLTIIGVDYAVMWALIAFLLNYIPNIGSIIAGIPAVLFALVQLGFGGALWTTGAYIAVNMVIGNVIEPKVMGKGMGLSTLVVFLSLIFWGFILGTAGMFLSVPLTMTMKIMLEQREETRWLAILLGTPEDARFIADQNREKIEEAAAP